MIKIELKPEDIKFFVYEIAEHFPEEMRVELITSIVKDYDLPPITTKVTHLLSNELPVLDWGVEYSCTRKEYYIWIEVSD